MKNCNYIHKTPCHSPTTYSKSEEQKVGVILLIYYLIREAEIISTGVNCKVVKERERRDLIAIGKFELKFASQKFREIKVICECNVLYQRSY